MMRIATVTSATDEPVTRSEAKVWLRVDEHAVDEDPLIDALVTRARERWEAVTQRAALVQTFDAWADAEDLEGGWLCDGPLTLPKAPLVSLVSITAFASSEATDTGGTAATVSDYYVDTVSDLGRVTPKSGVTWPTATRDVNALRVRFTAGYSSGSSGVPETVKREILALAARLYEHRGDEGAQAHEMDTYRSELDLPSWG